MRLPAFLGIFLIAAYLVISPRFSHLLFPFARQSSLDRLISQTQATRHLDAQKFWETREFYYPGVLYVYQDGLSERELSDFQTKSGLKLKSAPALPILTYDSPKWQSYEALVNTNVLSDYLNLPSSAPVYRDDETQIYLESDKTYIFFLKSYPELRVTNGFVYRSEEVLSQYNYWLGVSVITR
ncbi:MAG: hypothetical protein ACD_27C00032G0011 [uncultured bacterium]|nr:MAG: hypothetical protein ACD_27C00032G0011 [uncultured bacterium]